MNRRILLVLLAAGCAGLPAASGEGRVSLREGERARVGSLKVRFARVESDSRCAPGVQCIREGEAVVIVELSGGGEVRLLTAPADSAVREVDRHRVRLDALSAERPYRAWLTLQRLP